MAVLWPGVLAEHAAAARGSLQQRLLLWLSCCFPAATTVPAAVAPLPQKSATRLEMGEVAVNAAESAYDLVADMVRVTLSLSLKI